MKLSYSQQLIVIGVLVFLLAAVIVGLLILPQVSAITEADSRIADAEMQIQQAQTLLAQRQAIKARAAETEAKRMRLANQMPENPELPTLIVELQDTVNRAGLKFASLTPQAPQAMEEGYSEIQVIMLVQGTWADTVDLVQRLPRLTRQLRISSLTISPYEEPSDDDQATGRSLVQTNITIKVYTMPSDVAPPAVPAPEDAAETQ